MKMLTKLQCYEIIAEKDMMAHIVGHSIQVCRVALHLCDCLCAVGLPTDRNLIRASALLHDITKTRSFQTGENHAETGDRLMTEEGYPEVGNIVRQHVRLDTYDFNAPPSEVEIVNYADKRVLHDRIVSLDRRMDYIRDKYAHTPEHREKLEWLREMTKRLERKIFDPLALSPESLKEELPREGLTIEMCIYRNNGDGTTRDS